MENTALSESNGDLLFQSQHSCYEGDYVAENFDSAHQSLEQLTAPVNSLPPALLFELFVEIERFRAVAAAAYR